MRKYLYVSLLFFLAGHCLYAQKQGQQFIDSLLSQLPQMKDDTNKVMALAKLCYAYYSIDPDAGIRYGEQGLELSQKLEWEPGTARLNKSIAADYYMKSDYPKAITYFEKAVDIFKKLGDRIGIASCVGNLGIIYMNQSDFPKSLEYHLFALKMNEETGDEAGMATNMQNIGILYYSQEEYDKALQYYQKAIAIFERLKSKGGMAGNYSNIGNIYSAKKDYIQGIAYNMKALKIYEELGDRARIASCLGNIGNAYFNRGDILKAIDFNFRSLKMNKEIGNKNGAALNMSNIGNLYFFLVKDSSHLKLPDSLSNKKAVLKKAIDFIIETISIAEEIGDLDIVQTNYHHLSGMQSYSGNYEQALESYKKGVEINDSIFSNENKLKMKELEKQRGEDLKQKEIEIQRLQLLKARNERWYFVTGFAGLILLLLVVFNRFRVKKRSNEKLEKAYNELKATQQQLVQQEKLASLGALTAGIAHEIKNPLNFVNNFSDLSVEQIDELIAAEDPGEKNEIALGIRQNLDKISRHGKRADSIVQGMLQHARVGGSEREPTDINKLCNEIADLAFHGMKASTPDFNVEIKKEFASGMPVIKTVSQDISRVLVNLLGNAFYAVNEKLNQLKNSGHAEKYKPQVIISTSVDENSVSIKVEDNGVGIPSIIKHRIFEPFFTTKQAGQGTGLGLSICYDIIKSHGGELKVESTEGVSTVFMLSLPR